MNDTREYIAELWSTRPRELSIGERRKIIRNKCIETLALSTQNVAEDDPVRMLQFNQNLLNSI